VFKVLNILCFFDDECNKTGKVGVKVILRNFRLTNFVVEKQ